MIREEKMSLVDVEQQQIENIKRFWRKFGNLILTILLVIAIAYAGWTYYEKYKMNQVYAASSLYDSLLAQQGHSEQMIAIGNQVMTKYPSTVYASFSALILAQQYVKNRNYPAAKTSLTWVIDHSENPELIVLAQERLARILISENQSQAALKLLENVQDNSGFESVINMVKGDAYAQLNEPKLAKKYWSKALQSMTLAEDVNIKQYLQMKMSSISMTTKQKVKAQKMEQHTKAVSGS